VLTEKGWERATDSEATVELQEIPEEESDDELGFEFSNLGYIHDLRPARLNPIKRTIPTPAPVVKSLDITDAFRHPNAKLITARGVPNKRVVEQSVGHACTNAMIADNWLRFLKEKKIEASQSQPLNNVSAAVFKLLVAANHTPSKTYPTTEQIKPLCTPSIAKRMYQSAINAAYDRHAMLKSIGVI